MDLSRIKVRICNDADRAHKGSLRAYGHTFCKNGPVICVASEFFGLPNGHRDGILAHEIGHLLAGPDAGEEEADRAFEEETGVRILYKDGPSGRCLQWLDKKDGKALIGVFEFEFEGRAKDAPGPDGDAVRFFAKDADGKRELDSLEEAESVAAGDPDVDVWASEGRRRLGWRPMARNPEDVQPVDELPFTVICAWCQKQISGPPPTPGRRLSHGMCLTCRDGELAAAGLEPKPKPNPRRSPDAWKTPPPCDVEATGRPLTSAIARRLTGRPVRVHLNLHNGCYVFTHKGRVTAYAQFFYLRDVLPRVGVGGYRRCHELKVRNVHAYLEGTFVDGEPPAKRGRGWRQITYNCKTNQRPCFYYVDNEECFEGAEEVRAWRVDNGDGTERCEVWVKGEPPERRKNPPECRCELPGGACDCGAVDEECARVVADAGCLK